MLDIDFPCSDQDAQARRDMSEFIAQPSFPCVGAKSVRALKTLVVVSAGKFGCRLETPSIYQRLSAFGGLVGGADTTLRSFACVFAKTATMPESNFEKTLWQHLAWLHEEDVGRGIDWASDASSDPDSAMFGMSIAGHSYFVVGLHPGASRAARRFNRPALVFNSLRQFSRLRADGRYDAMQLTARKRDRAANGSINPMLGAHGQTPQAPQFSGRSVGTDWQCPFQQLRSHEI